MHKCIISVIARLHWDGAHRLWCSWLSCMRDWAASPHEATEAQGDRWPWWLWHLATGERCPLCSCQVSAQQQDYANTNWFQTRFREIWEQLVIKRMELSQQVSYWPAWRYQLDAACCPPAESARASVSIRDDACFRVSAGQGADSTWKLILAKLAGHLQGSMPGLWWKQCGELPVSQKSFQAFLFPLLNFHLSCSI